MHETIAAAFRLRSRETTRETVGMKSLMVRTCLPGPKRLPARDARLLRCGGALLALCLSAQAGPRVAAPPFTLTLLDGRDVSLGQVRGKVVVLGFWATWCAPCRQELADLDALAASYGSARVAAFAILAERKPDHQTVVRRARDLRMPVALWFSAGAAGYPLINNGVPTTYVIDKDEHIAFVKAGAFAPGELAARLRAVVEVSTPTARRSER